MAKTKVYVTRLMGQEALDRIQQETEMKVWEDELPPPYEVLKREATEVEGLVTMLEDRIDLELMEAAPKLKVISQMAVGFDNIAVEEATRKGIPVGHTPGVLSKTVADFAFALILATARRVLESDRFTRQGKWRAWHPRAFLGFDVYGSTLGIIGLGGVGLEVAKRAQGFDMEIMYYDVAPRPDAEEQYGLKYVPDVSSVLRNADFVTLHAPLMPETYHLIGEKELAMMKSTAILINTARGPLVDPKALHQALKNGIIAAAALDVTEPEPIASDDPLLELDNLIIAPHIASASVATRARMSMMAADNLLAGLRGEIPPNCVNGKELKG